MLWFLEEFDIPLMVQHPTVVLILLRRLAAVTAVLSLSVGNLAVCAGWQATPEARMACCENGTSCPMHKSESSQSPSKHSITQVQADNCCAAASNRTQSSAADPTFAPASMTTLLVSATLVVPASVPALQKWRALVPLPISPVPRHLRLSVLLV